MNRGHGWDTTEPDALCLWGQALDPAAGLALCSGGGFVAQNAELPQDGPLDGPWAGPQDGSSGAVE